MCCSRALGVQVKLYSLWRRGRSVKTCWHTVRGINHWQSTPSAGGRRDGLAERKRKDKTRFPHALARSNVRESYACARVYVCNGSSLRMYSIRTHDTHDSGINCTQLPSRELNAPSIDTKLADCSAHFVPTGKPRNRIK